MCPPPHWYLFFDDSHSGGCEVVSHGEGKLFLKGQVVSRFYHLCSDYSSQTLWHESDHRQYVSTRAWLYSNKMLLTKIGASSQAIVCRTLILKTNKHLSPHLPSYSISPSLALFFFIVLITNDDMCVLVLLLVCPPSLECQLLQGGDLTCHVHCLIPSTPECPAHSTYSINICLFE